MSTILSVLIPSMVSWHGSWVKLTSLEGLLRNDYCTIVAKFLTLTAFKCMPRRMLFRFSSWKPRVPERLGSRSKHTHLHPPFSRGTLQWTTECGDHRFETTLLASVRSRDFMSIRSRSLLQCRVASRLIR